MLDRLSPPDGARRKRMRKGRGEGSKGKTCGRGHGGQNSRTVTSIRLATTSTPVNHVIQHVQRIVDNLPRPLPLDVGHKSHATTVVFVGRIVQPVFFWTTISEHSRLATRCRGC